MNYRSLRDTLLVTRLYLLRGWRRALDSPRTLVLRVGALVVLWLYIVLGGAPSQPTDTDPAVFREMLRGVAAGFWLVLAAIAVVNTPTAANSIQGSPFLLRSAGLRPTLWGTVLGKYARKIVLFGLIVAATAVVLLSGYEMPTRNPLAFVTLFVFFLTAELAGMAVRLGVEAAGLHPSRALKVLLGGTGVIVLSVAIGEFNTTVALLSHLPVAAFGDAFAMGVPSVAANTTQVVAATVGGITGSVVLALLVEQFAVRAWFTGGSRERAGTERTRVDGLLGRVGVTGPTRAVAWRLWLQSRRQPIVIGILAVPVLVVGLAVFDPDGVDISLFPLFVGIYTVWMVTVAVGLNPLSSERNTLAHLLSAEGADVVRGYTLTTVCIGTPVIVAGVLPAGVLVGPLALTLPAVLLSVVVLCGIVPAAIAIGLVLPTVGRLGRAVDGPMAPGKYAIGAFSVLLGLLVAPAGLALTVAGSIPVVAVVAGVGVTVLAALAVGAVSLELAARRLDGMTLE